MFSFLKTGDIHGAVRQITNLPGFFIGDRDKIKYSLLNHSTAMRKNLSTGRPIFTNIRQWEAEIEKRDAESMMNGVLPSMLANAAAATAAAAASGTPSLIFTTENELRIDNAVLAFIMAKELAFLNRTIQMISLIATRYQEEEEDAHWGCSPKYDHDSDDGADDVLSSRSVEEDLEAGYCDDSTPTVYNTGEGLGLLRSQSHDYPYPTVPATATATATAPAQAPRPALTRPALRPAPKSVMSNQLVTTFLIASGNLMTRFNALCKLTGTDIVLVNAMTTRDQPHGSGDNLVKQLNMQSQVISDIYLHNHKFDATHRDPVVLAFQELQGISIQASKVLSVFAFSNLFRLTHGTDFAVYDPEDAIFTQSYVPSYSPQRHHQPAEESSYTGAEVEVEVE